MNLDERDIRIAANALRIAAGEFGPVKIEERGLWNEEYAALALRLWPASAHPSKEDRPQCKHGCVPAYSDGHRADGCWKCEVEHWKQRAEALEANMRVAAGELLIPFPTPGTEMAILLSANVLLRHERDRLLSERNRARAEATAFFDHGTAAGLRAEKAEANATEILEQRDSALALVEELRTRNRELENGKA